jgi:hypothetical protein
MIVKTGPDLNSAISAGAEIHLFRIFPRCGKTQSKGQPVTASENIYLHQVGRKGKNAEGKRMTDKGKPDSRRRKEYDRQRKADDRRRKADDIHRKAR